MAIMCSSQTQASWHEVYSLYVNINNLNCSLGLEKGIKTQGSCLANQVCFISHLALNSVWEFYFTCKSAYYDNNLPSVCDEAVTAIFQKI